MIFRTLLMMSILASGNQAQAAQNVIKSLKNNQSKKNLHAEKLLANIQGVNDWTKEFIGALNFTLMDDQIYAQQFQNLKNLEAELLRVRGMLNDKKKALDTTVANKQKKVTELQTTNTSLSDKQKLKTDLEKEVQLLTTDNTAQQNLIVASDNIIRVQSEEVSKLTTELNFWTGEYNNAVLSVNARQTAYDQALQNCQTTQPAGTDCTIDRDVVYAKSMLQQAVERKNYLESTKNAIQTRLNDANKKIADAQTDKSNATTKIAANNNKIQADNAKIQNLGNEIPVLISKAQTLTNEIKELTSQEIALIDDVKRMTSIEQSQASSYNSAVTSFDQMKNDLINQILAFNRAGYDKSAQDGAQEGIEIANNLGGQAGTNAGRTDGLRKGEADGRARDYQIGAAQGEGDGARDGKIEGAKAGSLEGKQAGHKAAGTKEGEASGITKANNSDASQVGRNLGQQAGLQRAAATGKDQGYRTGEGQAIQDQENDTLNNISVNGQFAGTFQTSLPGFPGVSGKYFNNTQHNTRRVLKEAYLAGYQVAYAPSAEKVYYENVKAIFDGAYAQSYQISYGQSFGVTYEDSIRQGRGAQYASAFDREYKIAYAPTYKQSFDQAIMNPDRQGSIFIGAFKTAETSAYNNRYAQIKDESFNNAERDTFNQNIGAQTEKFRLERFDQVSKIYSNFPVLKFISASIKDAGIRGVAAGDGFYMPGEDIAHSVVIANYGKTAATGVKVVLKSGESFTLPSVPGKAIVTVSGAGKEKIAVAQAIGSNVSTNISVKFGLSAQEKQIQGRHYANPADGSLNLNASSTVGIDYPIAVSELRLTEPLILKKDIALKAVISNRSQKDVSNVSLELDSNIGGAIATKFSDISFLDQSVTKSDAIIRIDNEEDVFRDIAFNLTVKVGDVVIGKISGAGKDIVRVPYKAINGAPVIVLSSASEGSRELFKDLMSEVGGVDRFSILDLNGFKDNQTLLDTKMSGKTLIAIDQAGSSIFPRMAGLVKTPNVSVVVLTERDAANAMQVLRNSMNDETSLNLKADRETFQVISTSPILTDGLNQKVSFIASKMRTLEAALKIAETLKLSDDALLAKIGAEVSKESFLARNENDVMLTKVLGLRIFEDAVSINSGYATADRKERKAWRKLQEDDSSLLVAKTLNKLEKGAGDEKVGISLASIPVEASIAQALDGSKLMETKVRKATLKATDDFTKLAKKNFGKSGKDLVKSVEAIQDSFFAGF